MMLRARPLDCFLLSIACDVAIVETLCFVFLGYALYFYDGRCPADFFMTNRPCWFPEYFGGYFTLVLVMLLVNGWRVVLVGFAIPPAIGLIIGAALRGQDGRA